MRILLDENLPDSLVDRLRSLGHDVDSINRLDLKGIANGELYTSVAVEYDLCFTKDTGFARNVRRMEPEGTVKLLLVTLPQRPAQEFCDRFFDEFTSTEWSEYQNGDPWPYKDPT